MPIYLGSTELSPAILEGVSEIYAGSDLVWQAGLPVGTVFNFGYTGDVQSVTLPRGRYKLQCWGAQGGSVTGTYASTGSKGGYSVGELTLTEETTLYIFVGGQGTSYTSSSSQTSTTTLNGGWNGGGCGRRTSRYNSSNTDGRSFPRPGGGATDISTVTSTLSYSSGRTTRDSASLLARCIVAGGGAGASARYTVQTTSSTNTRTLINSSYTTTIPPQGTTYWQGQSDTFDIVAGRRYNTTCTPTIGTLKLWFVADTSDWSSLGTSSFTASENGRAYIIFQITGESGAVDITVTESYTTSSTSTGNGKSNQSQQGGGTSGRGQYPGTQSSAGSRGAFGLGANQSTTGDRYCSGGGGGGWYGGGKASSDSSTSYVNYSGGGSGFVNTAANASYRPSGYTGLQLDSGSTTAGNSSFESTSGGSETGHSGNGYARITVID